MMRRSRISVRPNVRPGARAMTQDGQASKPAVNFTQSAEKEAAQPVSTETTPTGDKLAEVDRSPETVSPNVREKGQTLQSSAGGDALFSALQRRKRFSATPNLAKPRVTLATTRAAVRLPKSPLPKVPTVPAAEAVAPPPQDSGISQSLPRSPRWQRLSGCSRLPKSQDKQALLLPAVPASDKPATLSPALIASDKPAILSPAVIGSDRPAPLSTAALASDVPAPLSTAVLALDIPAPLSTAVLALDIPAPLSTAVLASDKPAPLSTAVLASDKPAPLSPAVIASDKPAPLSSAVLVSDRPAPLSSAVLVSDRPAPLSSAVLVSDRPAPLSPAVLTSDKPAPLSPAVPESGPGPGPQRRKEMGKPAPLQFAKSSDPGRSSQGERPLPDPAVVCAPLSQCAKSEVKTPFPLPPGAKSVSSDLERIAKARKLRELLRQELRKQRKRKKGKSHICEHSIPQDHNKMTMRDLIYYLPESNPMKSYPVEECRPTEKVIPPSPSKELPEKPQEPRAEAEAEAEVEELEDEEDDDEGDEPTPEDQLVVPRVKVAEDGTLILDEESLTVEVLRTKGPNVAEENDPIFERGSSTTYSSFRKAVYTKPWSNKETEMFFLAISMVGTDFSMIGQLFPHRARTEIKNKFKKEERENSWRIDKAFKEKCRFDLEFFSKHLERILSEEQLKRKKSKTMGSVAKKKRSKQKGKNVADQRAPRDQSTEEELDSDVVEGDSETAEKENEDCSNVVEAGADTTATKNNHKRKNWEGDELPVEKPADGRSVKMSRPTCEEGGSILSEDSEGLVNEAQPATTAVDRLKRPESFVQDRFGPEIRPAQLSRGGFQRPTPNLGRRLAKKAPQPGEKTGDGSGGDEDMEERSSKLQKGAAEGGDPEGTKPKRVKSRGDASMEEGSQEQKLNKPTSSRRVPKHSNQHKQAGNDDSAMESMPAPSSRVKGVATKRQGKQPTVAGRRARPKPNLAACQRNGRTGKSKLVTLRASLPEDNEEEEQDEAQPEDYHYPVNPEEQNQVPAFVPLSLRSPQPVTMEVMETMEELEISVNVPDVVGTAESEHVFCSQPVCQGAQDELALSTEHQLDLLVDVIDFLSPEHGAVSEESYNEAARTLLTIRNPELLSLAAPGYSTEIVIDEESPHHVQLEEPEPREVMVSDSADQLHCSVEHSQTVTSDLYITEAPQSFTQSAYDVDSMCLTPGAVAKFVVTVEESETVIPVGVSEPVTSAAQSEPDLNPQSGETTSMEDSTVTEEPYKEESATPLSAADSHSGASGPNPSVQNILQGRRSRFPKPKPNLVRACRTPRVSTAQCTEKSAAVGIVERECLKIVDVEKQATDNVPAEQVHENQQNKGSIEDKARQDEATHAGNSPDGVVGSDVSSQNVPSSKARRFPKPRPNLDRAVRSARVPPTLRSPAPSTGDGRKEAAGDTKAEKPPEGENSASGVNNMTAEPANNNKGNTSAGDRETEGQNIMNPSVDTEEVDRAYGTVIPCPAGGGEKAPETASFDTVQEATCFHMEGDLSTAVSHQVTEGAIGQQSTFILTLFEVPPPLLGEFGSGVDPPGTVTAELLSPLVFVNEQPASPPTQPETHSCYPLSVGVELEDRDPPVPASEDQGGWGGHSAVRERTGSPTGVSGHTLMGPVDSCERSISLTLVPVEESCFSEAGEEGASKQSSLPKMRKTPARTRKGNLQVKPITSMERPEDPTEGDQIVLGEECLPPTPAETSPRADAPHSLPSPAVQRTCMEPATMPETSTAEEFQGIVGWSDLPKLDGGSTAIADDTASSPYKEPRTSHQAMPTTSSSPLTTTGRKPKGFLSFISNKTSPVPASAPRPVRPASQRPQVNASRLGRRRTATVDSPPPRVTPSPSESGSASKLVTTQVSEASEGQLSCIKTSKTDMEPTSVSEYFFSDIFTQVEEPE